MLPTPEQVRARKRRLWGSGIVSHDTPEFLQRRAEALGRLAEERLEAEAKQKKKKALRAKIRALGLKRDCIIAAVAQLYDLPAEEIRGASRKAHPVRARQMAMYLCRKWTNSTLNQIGRSVNKDHTSVMNAVRKYEKLQNDVEVVADIELIHQILRGENHGDAA